MRGVVSCHVAPILLYAMYAKLYAAMPWEIVTVCRHSWSAKFGDAA